MIGPLPTAPGGFSRVLVAIDKFTKWIKVKLVSCPRADRVLDFLDKLVHRYGLPYRIITDLGSNFNNHQFWSTARTARTTSGMSQSPIHGPMDKSSVPTVLTVKIRQPSHEFTFGVGMTFVSYPLVLTPVV
jgi:hypothetical protein